MFTATSSSQIGTQPLMPCSTANPQHFLTYRSVLPGVVNLDYSLFCSLILPLTLFYLTAEVKSIFFSPQIKPTLILLLLHYFPPTLSIPLPPTWCTGPVLRPRPLRSAEQPCLITTSGLPDHILVAFSKKIKNVHIHMYNLNAPCKILRVPYS